MTQRKLLVIEDEPAVARQLQWGLGAEYEVTVAGDAEEARRLLATSTFPVITLDLGLPPFPGIPQEGLRLLEDGVFPADSKVIVITGNSEEETAVRAVGMGATDFCSKPVDLGTLTVLIDRAFRMHALERAGQASRRQANAREEAELCGMVGASPVMLSLFDRIRRAASTDFPVLITGESGTGKEMIAQAVHRLSSRREKPLVIVNCGAIPGELMASELFGHEKGAFTGAHGAREGKFEQADGGTIFLDEVGEIPIALQVKLLRALQEGTVERIGGRKTIRLDFRTVAATNVDLERAVSEGRFRQDLYYRLNVIPLQAPALRDRQGDITLLARHFLEEESSTLGFGRRSFAPASLRALAAHPWPGNVRELRNLIRRALATGAGPDIGPADLGLKEAQEATAAGPELESLAQTRRRAEESAVRQAMASSGNNISQAARLLGVSRPTMHDLLKKYGISG